MGYTVHDAANVLRRYLNQLPEPIVPLEFYERFREPLRIYQQAAQASGGAADAEPFDHPKAVAAYQQLIRELPPLNKQLLLYILDLLAVFASKSDQNRMPSANLAAIFQPGMLSHPQHYMSPEEYKLSQDVLIFLIENQDHFLFGMNGTAADEQTVKEVQSGMAARPATYSNVRRSVSSASNGRESFRKYDGLRRNVSVSSKNSRNSNNPGTPQSFTGVGVHRSNTLPSKISPAIPPSRLARTVDPVGVNPAGLAPPARHSRSTSQTPPPLEENIQTPTQEVPVAPGVYTHSSTHGPVRRRTVRTSTSEKPHLEGLPTAASPPPAATPTKERKISNIFAKSPPQSSDHREVRQPNRLKKRRIPGSASESAQSSSLSLQGAMADNNANAVPHSNQTPAEANNEAGGATPKPPVSSNPADEATPQVSRDGNQDPGESGRPTDNALRPHVSRTPSMNSHSSFTDQSEFDPTNDASKAERKENRRSWRFPRPSKRSNEQLGLGLESPPLAASSSGAERSTSSIGSWHHSSKSSPSDLQQFDPSGQLLSLDAEVHNNGNSKESLQGPEERKSLFGKFKAKVAQVRDGVKEWDAEREKSKSPVQAEADRVSRTLSPTGRDSMNGKPAAVEAVKDAPGEQAPPPTSPTPNSGPPPAIPEEPSTPEKPSPTVEESLPAGTDGPTAADATDSAKATAAETRKESVEAQA